MTTFKKTIFAVLSLCSGILTAVPAMAADLEVFAGENVEQVQAVDTDLPICYAQPDMSQVDAIGFSGEEWELLYRTNVLRLEKGNQAEGVTVFKKLQSAANIRKQELPELENLSHERPGGGEFKDILDETGITYTYCAENYSKGQNSAKAAAENWYGITGYRTNMLNASYSHMAAGHSYADGTDYWVQLFIGDCTPTSISVLNDSDLIYGMEKDQTIDGFGFILEVTCEHGTSYMTLMDRMCTYDKNLLNEVQDVTVKYKGAQTTFKLCVLEKLPYEDVSEYDWFYNYVADAYYNGLMTGLDSTTFGPYESVSRAQFAVILHRMEGEPDITYSDVFPDISKGTWYTNAVLWANKNEIVTGYTDTGRFRPAEYITREQMAVMMYRYARYLGYSAGERADISSYADASGVSAYAKEAMQWAVANGIITGKNNGKYLEPQGVAKRAECATIISRFVFQYLNG